MKKRLSILITHFNEPLPTIKRMLDSIAIQQNVNWDDIEVIIGDDGGQYNYGEDPIMSSYPFSIDYYVFEKGGISATRNKLLQIAKGEFVEFCDGDDMFYGCTGIWFVLKEISKGDCDGICNEFLCEIRRPDNGEIDYVPYAQTGWQFVHAKVMRKSLLIDNDINFREDSPVHEDAILFGLAKYCTNKIKFSPMPYYVWCHNDNSVSRKDKYYLQHTTKYLLMNQSWVIEKLYKKGLLQPIREHAYSIFCDMYYSLAGDQWLEDSTKEDRKECEGMFKFFYNKYKKFADELTTEQKKQIELGQKQMHTMQGLSFEKYTWFQWMEHIEKEVEPIEFEIKSSNE